LRDDVAREARKVLWSEAQAQIRSIAAEARAAQRAYVEKSALGRFMHQLAPWPYPEDNADAVALRTLVQELEIAPLQWASAKGGPVDPAERWKAALEALQEDANAKLPR
jgi:hypothetical protein